MVGGVTPGKGGTTHLGLPVFDTVRDAVEATGATASVIYVPAPFCKDSILEAVDAGIEAGRVHHRRHSDAGHARDQGAISRRARYALDRPELSRRDHAGRVQDRHHAGRHPSCPARSASCRAPGTLTYEAVKQTTDRGFGQSTCVGIGGDPIPGSHFIDILALFEKDPATEAIVMVGEIGGTPKKKRRRSSRTT